MADLSITAADVRLSDVHAPVRMTIKAGIAMTAGMAAYEASTGLAAKSVAVAIASSAKFDGIIVNSPAIGEAVTIFMQGSVIHIGAHGLAIGAFIYSSDTAGLLSDTAIRANEMPIAKAISATAIQVIRMDLPVI